MPAFNFWFSGCNVNCIKILNTPLHLAARQQDVEAVSILLQFGAKTTMTNNYDLTPKDMVPSSTSSVRQIIQLWESRFDMYFFNFPPYFDISFDCIWNF